MRAVVNKQPYNIVLITHDPFLRMDNAATQLHGAGGGCQAGDPALLRSILLRVSSLITGEDLPTDQVRDEDLFFMTETRRVSVDTGTLPSVPPRDNLKATMVPVGPLNRRTRRTVGRLTGGRGVDMKDECHTAVSLIKESCPWCPPSITPS